MTQQAWKKANEPASSFSLGDHVGTLGLFVVGGLHPAWPVGGETAPAVRGCFVAVDGPRAGEEGIDVLWFAVKVVDQLGNEPPGSVILGRVRAERGRGSNSMLSIDTNLTPTDEQWAQYWVAQHPGRLEQLQAIAVASYNNAGQRASGNGGQPQSQAAPPPPPPPPAAPPAAYVMPLHASGPPPVAPPAGPPAPSAPPGPPAPPAAPWAPPPTSNAHILGGPPAPGDTSTPPY